jgi:VIT1/CCC1 family predicted Fe2+/Mn2+ transporter
LHLKPGRRVREIERLSAEHRPDVIAARLDAPPRPSLLRDLVYGAIDGTVTTYAVVAGVAGSGLEATVVLVLGAANLVADGFSMAVANFLGIRSEERRRLRVLRQEQRHIELWPAGEREEVRQLLARDGLTGDVLATATDAITADRQRWIDVMMAREHGFGAVRPEPLRAATATFLAFVAVGVLPLLAFVVDAIPDVDVTNPYAWSTMLAALAFVAVGAVQGIVVDESWWRGAATTLGIGGAAAALAYVVGLALGNIV